MYVFFRWFAFVFVLSSEKQTYWVRQNTAYPTKCEVLADRHRRAGHSCVYFIKWLVGWERDKYDSLGFVASALFLRSRYGEGA